MYGHDSLTMEFDLTRTNHRKNVLYKISYAKEVLDQASKIYWICDSKRPREHFNYVRLTKLLQGIYLCTIILFSRNISDEVLFFINVAGSIDFTENNYNYFFL